MNKFWIHASCAAKRHMHLLTRIACPFLKTFWAIGVSVAGTMVISTLTH